MFCESCGSLIPEDQSYCPNCGAQAPLQVSQPVQQASTAQPVFQQTNAVSAVPSVRPNRLATVGLVFGMLTLFTSFIPVIPWFLGFFGLLFSILGLVKKNARGKGEAIAGLIMTVIGVVACFLFIEFMWKPAMERIIDSFSGGFGPIL